MGEKAQWYYREVNRMKEVGSLISADNPLTPTLSAGERE